MIRLLITDVDGTLVEEGNAKLNPEYYEVIRKLHEKGVQVLVASGRAFSSIYSLMKPVDDIIWYIADGGTRIKTTGEMEYLGQFPRDWLEEAWQDIRNIPGCDGVFCGDEWVYCPHEDSMVYDILHNRYKMKVKELNGWDYLPDVECSKFSIFRQDGVEKVAAESFIPKWKDKIDMVSAGEWWIDCMMKGVNKGSAIQKIMDEFGYKKEETMATGDNMNDKEMLEVVGIGIAVSSAREELKAIADRVIGNYKTDAVLNEWKKILAEYENL